MAPASVTVPAVLLSSAPAPASTPLTVPACMSNEVEADTVAVETSVPPVS